MPAAVRVRLTPALKREAEAAGRPVLAPSGPFAAIGGSLSADGLAVPVKPDALSVFGPRAACLTADHGLWVSDTGHHRLLGWAKCPRHDGVPADWTIGQPDFVHEGRNAKGQPGPTTLNVPTGITRCADGIAVADAWNHRILIWRSVPHADNVLPDCVLGQADFTSVEGNRGCPSTQAASLFWPYGVHWDGQRLWVADTGNRRVLMWDGMPTRNGQAADLVLGQPDFVRRDENRGADPTAASMRWPHGIALWNGRLCVADAGNNRIMLWDTIPESLGAPCDRLLGQRSATLVDHNQSLYWPSSATLNMPYGIAASGDWLLAADTANSRLLAWHTTASGSGAAACALTGQAEFCAKGDNRWQLVARDSLCWPYGLDCSHGVAAISDSGNNRVLLWRLAAGLVP
jgi:hypothetical protein